MNYRNKTNYPPYTHLLQIVVSNLNESRCKSVTESIYDSLNMNGIRMYKPYKLRKINNFYRERIILIGKNKKELLDNTWSVINKHLNNNYNSRITIDVDPLYIE